MASTLDVMSAKVRNFYANVDPTKSQGEMDEVTFLLYSKGEAHVNANLRAKYNGMDLSTFPLGTNQFRPQPATTVVMAQPMHDIPVASAATVVQSAPGNPAMILTENGRGQKVVFVPQQLTHGTLTVYSGPGGPTPFSSSSPYGYQPQAYYDPYYRQQQSNSNWCLGLAALFTCLLCLDFD